MIDDLPDCVSWPTAPADWRDATTDVQVWLVALDRPAADCQSLSQLLAPDEQRRAAQIYGERERCRFIVGRGSLRRLLGLYLEHDPAALIFDYGAHGKPRLRAGHDTPALHFNISHSEGLALYAISRQQRVGVDLEYLRPLAEIDQLVGRCCSEQEQAAIRSLPAAQQARGFYTCWTRKEAYIKAIGKGLAQPLQQITVSLLPDEPARLLAVRDQPDEAHRWSLVALHPHAEYAAALAVEGHGWRLDCWRWDEACCSKNRCQDDDRIIQTQARETRPSHF